MRIALLGGSRKRNKRGILKMERRKKEWRKVRKKRDLIVLPTPAARPYSFSAAAAIPPGPRVCQPRFTCRDRQKKSLTKRKPTSFIQPVTSFLFFSNWQERVIGERRGSTQTFTKRHGFLLNSPQEYGDIFQGIPEFGDLANISWDQSLEIGTKILSGKTHSGNMRIFQAHFKRDIFF